MSVSTKTLSSVFPVTEVKAMPIVAVLFDCLLLSAGIFYFTGMHKHHVVVTSKPKPIVAAAKQAPRVHAGVLGAQTVAPQSVTATPKSAAKPSVVALLNQSADPTPFAAEPSVPTPTPSVEQVANDPAATSGGTTGQQTSTNPTTDPGATANNPAAQTDFTTTITQAGQVLPGTLIALNTTKGEKAYYGGDLVLSTSTVTVSKSHLLVDPVVTISTPDGTTVGMPSTVGTGPMPTLSMDAATAISAGTSFPMIISAGTAAAGTYTLHFNAFRTSQTAEAWQYDGFITVTIVD